MASEKESLEFSSNVEASAAADYLEALARGLREGHILVESGDRSINLEVASDLNLEFEAKASPDKGKSAIELQLSWSSKQPKEAPPSLLIASSRSEPDSPVDEFQSSELAIPDHEQ